MWITHKVVRILSPTYSVSKYTDVSGLSIFLFVWKRNFLFILYDEQPKAEFFVQNEAVQLQKRKYHKSTQILKICADHMQCVLLQLLDKFNIMHRLIFSTYAPNVRKIVCVVLCAL